MKMNSFRILMTLLCLAGFSVKSQAEVRGEIKVKIPFASVINGHTVPAGTYVVSRFTDDKNDGLILSSYDNHVNVLIRASSISDAKHNAPSVSFVRVGMQEFVSRIETADDVYTFPVQSKEILLAQQKEQQNATHRRTEVGR